MKKPINTWINLNERFDRQRSTIFVLASSNVFLCLLTAYLSLSPPLVVVKEHNEKFYLRANRQDLKVTPKDLESIATKFIFARYQWDSFERSSILKGITPFISKNLLNKVGRELKKLSKQFPKEKSISQSIANLKSKVTMKKIIISFDRVLKVDGLPLVTPTEVEFLMMEGSPNFINPTGVYINNVIQYETL